MHSLIFAAGLGTRLKPLTNTTPKALVEVAGKPLLAHVLEKIRLANFTNAVINVHHFGEQIIDLVAKNDFGISTEISDERDLLRDTGGGIRHAQKLLPHDQPFLVHNVDILSNINLQKLMETHHKNDLATLVVSQRKTSRYLLFDDENRLVGWTNVQTGEVRSANANLDIKKCKMRAFAGIHVISPDCFELMKNWPEKFSIIDFYLAVCQQVTIRAYEPENFKMIDVGKLDSLAEAEKFVN